MEIEWQSNPPQEFMTWEDAMKYAKSLGDGWRLPTRGELINAYKNDVIGFQKNSYWSLNTYAHNNNNAWTFYFNVGFVDFNDKTNLYYVRCVRDIKENEK